MCGATQRGRGSPSALPAFPSATGTDGVPGSPGGGGGGGGTVGLATDFRWIRPESRNERIGLESTGDGPEGDTGLGNSPTSDGLPVEEILGDMSAPGAVDDGSRPEKKSSDPEP